MRAKPTGKVTVELKDPRGDMIVVKGQAGYRVWFEVTDVGRSYWESSDTDHSTLALAMAEVIEILEIWTLGRG